MYSNSHLKQILSSALSNPDFKDNKTLRYLLNLLETGKIDFWSNSLSTSARAANYLSILALYPGKPAKQKRSRKATDSGNSPENKLQRYQPIGLTSRKADLRPHAMSISGIKTYPADSESGKLPRHGILFCKRCGSQLRDIVNPQSSVFIGANGSGKTSLFTSLELIAMGRSHIADLHGFKTPEEQNLFFLNTPGKVFEDSKEPKILLHTRSGTKHFDLSEANKSGIGIPSAFFCSEYDVNRLEREEIEPAYFCDQLGFIQLYFLYSFLSSLRDAMLEANNLKELNNLTGKTLFGENSISETHGADSNGSHQENSQIPENVGPTREEFEKKEKEFKENFGIDYDKLLNRAKISNEIAEIQGILSSEYDAALRKFDEIATPLIKAILNPHNAAHETLSVGINEGQERIADCLRSYKISINISGKERRPRDYYNTYRFKLYTFAVKTAIAVATREILGIDFPIVIDDIFDGSDFDHRSNIEKDVCNLLKAYKNLGVNQRHPLQVIMFSQDDLIAKGFHRALYYEMLPENVKFSRIHRPEDVDKNIDAFRIQTTDSADDNFCLVETLCI